LEEWGPLENEASDQRAHGVYEAIAFTVKKKKPPHSLGKGAPGKPQTWGKK